MSWCANNEDRHRYALTPPALPTAVRYYGGQPDNCKSPLFTVDYLELNLKGVLPFDEENKQVGKFRFELSEKKTRFYNNYYNVFHGSRLFGVMLTKPRSPILPANSIQFKVDNQHFYNSADWVNTIYELLQENRLSFNSVTRLDLACDFESFANGWGIGDFVEKFITGKIERLGRVSKLSPHYELIEGKAIATGFLWGKRSSEKYARCYDKIRELKQQPSKQYILEYLRNNGLKGDVTRFEFTVTSKEVAKYPDFLLADLIDCKKLHSLFHAFKENYFQFVKSEGKKVKKRQKPVNLLEWEGLRLTKAYAKISKKTENLTVRGVMLGVKSCLREFYIQNDKDACIMALRMAGEHAILDYLEKRYTFYFSEFAALCNHKRNHRELLYIFEFLLKEAKEAYSYDN